MGSPRGAARAGCHGDGQGGAGGTWGGRGTAGRILTVLGSAWCHEGFHRDHALPRGSGAQQGRAGFGELPHGSPTVSARPHTAIPLLSLVFSPRPSSATPSSRARSPRERPQTRMGSAPQPPRMASVPAWGLCAGLWGCPGVPWGTKGSQGGKRVSGGAKGSRGGKRVLKGTRGQAQPAGEGVAGWGHGGTVLCPLSSPSCRPAAVGPGGWKVPGRL